MSGYLGNSQMPGYLGNFSHLRNFQNLKNIPPSNTYRNLGNFPNAWISGNFPKCLGIWEISKILKKIQPSNTCRYLGNFPDTQAFGKFPRYPGIWEASQIPLKCLGIWEIPQMPGYLGNFQNLKNIQPSNTRRHLRVVYF